VSTTGSTLELTRRIDPDPRLYPLSMRSADNGAVDETDAEIVRAEDEE
jgi:hypothetical protein